MEVDKELLRSLYWDNEMSVAGVASKIGLSEESARRLMIKLGVPRKPRSWKCAGSNKGVPMTEGQRKLLSDRRKELLASGELVHWNSGRSCPDAVRTKISESLLAGREPAESNYGPSWRMQRTACLQRDGHRCQQCGSSNNVEVHHWEPYRFSFDNSLDNLVALCEKCHKEIHAMYRREGFTAEAEEVMYG